VGLEAHYRISGRCGPHLAHVFLDLAVAARISRSADLSEEPCRREPGKLAQARIDDAAEGIDLACDGRARRIAHQRIIQLAIELSGSDPVIDSPPRNAKLARDFRLAQPPLQIVT
jgi:hypothetical protein